MLCVPEEIVTVMLALGRSMMTVSFWPSATDAPAAPGRRGVGSGPDPIGVSCPGDITGAGGACPLFQFVSVDQSPLESFIHTAGTRKSFTYWMSPCDTFTSTGAIPCKLPLLLYCQKFH